MLSGRISILSALAVAVLVVVLYLPTLRGGFVYDSIAQVLHSDYIHTPSHWVDVLTLRIVGLDELDRNRPLLLASLMADAAIWGRNPFGYRLTSVLLHALNTSLLFVFIAAIFRRRTSRGGEVAAACAVAPPSPAMVIGLLIAAFGALVFALHPLVVEAVAEPSNREDLLVLLPVLIGLLCIAAPVRSMFVVNTALALCSFLAVLSKESGIAAPFVFAAACWLFHRADFRRFLPGLLGGVLVALAFLAACYVWRPGDSAIFANAPRPLAGDARTVLEVQLRIWTLQLWHVVWPWNLSAHYSGEAIEGITLPVAIVATVALLIAAILALRMDRLASLGAVVYVLALLPASNFAAQYHPVADRYLYVPLAGIGMVAAALGARLRIRYPSRFAGVALCASCLVVLSIEYTANLRRQFVWQEPMSLWTDVLRQNPRTAQALVGLANAHYRAGDFESALAAADEAVDNSSGSWAEPFAMRALCEWQTGRHGPALESFRTAQRLSRAYESKDSLAAALVWSPDQLQLLEIVRHSSP